MTEIQLREFAQSQDKLPEHLETLLELELNCTLIYNKEHGSTFPYFTKEKLGVIDIVYQPWFVQVLKPQGYVRKDFVKQVALYFKNNFWQVQFNVEEKWGEIFEEIGFSLSLNSNFFLENKARLHLHNHHKRHINRSLKQGLRIKKVDVSDTFHLFEQYLFPRIPNLGPEEQNLFEKFCNNLENQDKLVALGVFNDLVLCSACIFYKEGNTWTYLKGVNDEKGAKYGAMTYAITTFIEGMNDYDRFSFAGSNIPSIAEYFKRFGATEEKYYTVKYTRYPFLHKLRRKIIGS